MSAIIDRPNVERIAGHVDQAGREARMTLQGQVLERSGNFVTPSRFAIEDTSSPLAQDELFAPMTSFETFADEGEANRQASAIRFGLAASLWPRDLDRACRVSRRMHADPACSASAWLAGAASMAGGSASNRRAIRCCTQPKHVDRVIVSGCG